MESTPETRAMAQSVINYIELNPKKHMQSAWFAVVNDNGEIIDSTPKTNGCGTTMCAAGTVAWLEHGDEAFKMQEQDPDFCFRTGARLLGLDMDEARELFYDTNNEEALLALRHLAKGEEMPEFDWS